MTGTVEKVYSDALFELAAESGRADAVNVELALLSKIFRENPDMVRLLGTPSVTGAEKADFVQKVFGGKTSELTYHFIRLLVDKKRAAYLPAVSDCFRKRVNDVKNIAEVKVTSAEPLSADARAKLKAKLESVYKKTVVFEETVDPEIMGGVIVNYGNTLLDGSVKTKLDSVSRRIKEVIA